ncbi:MAG: homocysteine S-methyltransferase [Gammaproteobacteria bacterium]|nr:homocysteine S-methyltransferase [Gammaproteobacteria bacterium]
MNRTSSKFPNRLKQQKPILLDGGMGSELERRGFDVTSALWSAQLLVENPDAIKAVHLAYLHAGAECITTASYQASIPGFLSMGYSTEQAREFLLRSVDIARVACDEFILDNPHIDYRPMVAASIGPYGAYLADGGEYRGDYRVDSSQLHDFHQQRLLWLDDCNADVIACETIPDYEEAEVLAKLLAKARTPAWVSFSCRDGERISDGSLIRDAVALFEGQPGVAAVGVNCTAPQYLTSLIGEIQRAETNLAIVVYPNSGEDYDAVTRSWAGTETPLECAAAARTWSQAGANIIGGCCRMGPAHIAEIAKALHTQVNLK